MAGYSDTRQLIIDTLTGRPAGTEIQPEDHQAFALALNDYIRNVELNSGNAFIGFAQADTVPIQSDNGQCFYISTVPPSTNIVYANFIDSEGNPISVTTPSGKMAFVTLIWNTRNWDSQITIIETNWSQVLEDNIASEAVTGPKIAPNSISTSKIIDGTIQSTDLNPNAFDNTLTTSGKIAPADVVGSKLTELDEKFQEKLQAGDGIKIEGNVISNDFDHSEFATKESVEQGLLGKQDVIPDLESIREGANKGSTALQEHQDISHLLPKSEFQAYETKNDGDIQSLKDIDDRMKLLLGFNASRSIVNLELGVSGKYVKCESRSEVANSSFAISKPFAVDACSELLIKTGFNPSDESHAALDLTVIAIYEEIERQRTVQKKDVNGNPLYYVVTVDSETGSTTVTTDETTENTGYPVYTQETYTEQRYLPNNEDRFVAIPDSGYYVANIPQSCKVAISYKPGVSDTAVIVEKHGALANLISQVFGIYEHRTMAEAMVSLAARVDALESRQGLLGNATAGTLDVSELTKCLYPTILKGHGVPSATNVPVNLPAGLPWDGVPVFIGQFYINLEAASEGLYYAIGHDSVADWKQA